MTANRPRTTTGPGSDEEWIVEGFTRRAVWTTETTECANCGSTFELDTPHYYATLRLAQDTDASLDSEEIAVCSRSCAEEWIRS